MRTLFSFSIVSAALLSSIATSPPVFSVYERVKGTHTVDRGDDLELGIDVLASAEALPMPAAPPPVVEEPPEEVDEPVPPAGREPQVEGPEEDVLVDEEPGGVLTSELDVILEIDTRGTLGTNREDTEVVVGLWRTTEDGDVLLDEIEADVTSESPAFVELFTGRLFATCEIQQECLRSFVVTVDQSGDAKLRIQHEVSAHIRGDRGSAAPKEATIDIDVYAL